MGIDKRVDDDEARLKAVRGDEIDRCKAAIAEEENGQWMATSYQELMQAKKENVGLQLETANVLRAAEQRHMVQWIIDNVRKSITAKQEGDALKACVADLKALAK